MSEPPPPRLRGPGPSPGKGRRPRKSGFVALIGRPNAGKSTLLNRLVGEKLAIVSDKPQTTRNRILGARTYDEGQIVFVDTPGVHRPLHRLNVRMVDAAFDALREVDLVVVVVDASEPTGAGDRFLMDAIRKSDRPRVLALNKVDRVEKSALLPLIARYAQQMADRAEPGQETLFADIVPVSAKTGENVDRLERVLLEHLPEGEALYPEDFLTDQPERFFVAELVREQVLRETHAELPFSTAVVVDKFDEPDPPSRDPLRRTSDRGLMRLYCTILVDRESQKPILVGRQGAMIKRIGTAARMELERFFDTKVFLDLHVKVRADWRENERVLDELGLPAARKRRASERSRRP